MARTNILAAVVVFLLALVSIAVVDSFDINADPPDRPTTIAHISDERAGQLIAGQPRPSVRSLTGINGIGRGRIRDILERDQACVGVHAPRGQCEMIGGVAIVLDADTFQVAGERLPRRQTRSITPEARGMPSASPQNSRSRKDRRLLLLRGWSPDDEIDGIFT